MNRTLYILLTIFGMCMPLCAQNNDRDCIRMGNKYFREQDYSKAETYYRKALEQNESLEALYNLGNALAFQGNDSLAYDSYTKAVGQMAETPEKKAWVYHNMGNLTYLNGRQMMKANSPDATKAFAQAVECYKSALRCNPHDNETRYNLALAQYMLKKNQDQQDQKDAQQQQANQQKAQQQQAEEQRGQMDDRTAEQLLNSAQQDEKGVQRKVQKAEKAHRRGLERDW